MVTFTRWYQGVCTKLTKSGQIKVLETEFTAQTTDRGRISTLITNDVLLKEKVEESFRAKNNKQSESYRTVGNKFYSTSTFDHAVNAYTRAIKHAECDSATLALAYANRSAVLFAMQEYASCKDDILLALESHYPDELQFKLYERLGNCYYKHQVYHEARTYFKSCVDSLSKSNLTEGKQKEKEMLLNSLIEKCRTEGDGNRLHEMVATNQLYEAHLPEIVDHNKTYLSASTAFTMKYDEAHGRYAVASRDIKAGEVIIREKPFASVCLSSCFETHCYLCLKRFKYAYPCRNCSRISYCSVACEHESWKSFHQYECCYLELLIQDDVGLGHLAMKVVLRNDMVELQDFDSAYNETENVLGLNKNGVFDPESYSCLYSLVGNSESRTHPDLFRRTLLSIFLTKILQNTGYFEDNRSNVGGIEAIVASHMLKQIQMLPCNAHEISEAQLANSSSTDLASNELTEIGSAAYTTLSLLNHSCDPSVVRHCYQDACVVRALKHISQGEEIIDNYGFLYAVEEKQDRIKHLQDQYYFTCQCIPCCGDWPLYSELPNRTPQFKCSHCSDGVDTKSGVINEKTFICTICSKEDTEVEQFHNQNTQIKFESAMQRVLSGDGSNVTEDLDFLLAYLDLLTKKAVLPNIHVNNCQEIVKLCFSLSANFARLK